MTFEKLDAALDACIADGKIYNVDFNDWKTYAAGRMLEAEMKAVTNALYLDLPRDVRQFEGPANDLYWAIGGVSILTFPSKKLVAAVDAAMKSKADNGYGYGIYEVIEKWSPVADKFRTLKTMIVKGRKPSTEPRKTEERTLENTGTCPVCGKNVKLSGGKIVAHGFTIRHGWQEGNCFGVGYAPIEVSPVGAVAYRDMVLGLVEDRARSEVSLITNRPKLHKYDHRGVVVADLCDGEDGYQARLESLLYQLGADIRAMNRDVARFDAVIKNWTPGVLPG